MILSKDDARLIKTLSNLKDELSQEDQKKLISIGMILREYYRENTQFRPGSVTEQFRSFGINEDDGKAAIACARRFGIDIS